jgi:hypothetical protein
MSVNFLNQARNDSFRLQPFTIEDTGLHVPPFKGSINVNSKDGRGNLSVSLMDGTTAYIKLVNLDPEFRIMSKSVSMTETYLTTIRSSADIPKFLLWLQGKVRYLSSRTMVDGMYFECFNNIRIPQTTPTTYSITI